MKNRRIQNQFGKHRSKNTPPEFNIRFEKYLNQRGYKHHTIRAYVKSINHHWRPVNNQTISIA